MIRLSKEAELLISDKFGNEIAHELNRRAEKIKKDSTLLFKKRLREEFGADFIDRKLHGFGSFVNDLHENLGFLGVIEQIHKHGRLDKSPDFVEKRKKSRNRLFKECESSAVSKNINEIMQELIWRIVCRLRRE